MVGNSHYVQLSYSWHIKRVTKAYIKLNILHSRVFRAVVSIGQTEALTSVIIFSCSQMQFNGVYNKECKSCLCGQRHLDLCMHQNSRCSWATRHSSSFTLAVLFSSIRVSSTGTQRCFLLSCPSFLFVLFYQCGGCSLSPFQLGAHGWVSRICQPW